MAIRIGCKESEARHNTRVTCSPTACQLASMPVADAMDSQLAQPPVRPLGHPEGSARCTPCPVPACLCRLSHKWRSTAAHLVQEVDQALGGREAGLKKVPCRGAPAAEEVGAGDLLHEAHGGAGSCSAGHRRQEVHEGEVQDAAYLRAAAIGQSVLGRMQEGYCMQGTTTDPADPAAVQPFQCCCGKGCCMVKVVGVRSMIR